LDEVSPLGPTHVIEVIDGATRRWAIHPEEHGFRDIAREDLAGSGPVENARIIDQLLDGGGPPGARAAIILNAAAAIYVSGRVKSYAEGVAAATESIDSGHAKAVLERLKLAYSKPLKARV
jgi:anthranilate phosphoribosyltransferase